MHNKFIIISDASAETCIDAEHERITEDLGLCYYIFLKAIHEQGQFVCSSVYRKHYWVIIIV